MYEYEKGFVKLAFTLAIFIIWTACKLLFWHLPRAVYQLGTRKKNTVTK